jgi:hypothetical protein
MISRLGLHYCNPLFNPKKCSVMIEKKPPSPHFRINKCGKTPPNILLLKFHRNGIVCGGRGGGGKTRQELSKEK